MMSLNGEMIENVSFAQEYINNLVRYETRTNRMIDEEREDEILKQYYNPFRDDFINEKLPYYIDFMKSQRCLMVEEQRLNIPSVYRFHSSMKTVEQIQDKLEAFFGSAQKTYNQESLKIDASFIKRLSDYQDQSDGKLKHIKKEKIYQEVTSIIKDYQKFGLVKELNVVSDLGVHYNEVLKLYLQDLKTKLDSIAPFYRKLATFDRLVSGKKLSNKHIVFEDDKFLIVDSNGNVVPIGKLSSGEQNLIILCYKLVFELDNKSVLLVDEPENSLHMAWLEKLLADYLNIAKATGCQIIIATHSPAFIHGKWDLTYDLCENEISNS